MNKLLIIFCLLLCKNFSFGQCDNTLHPSDNAQVAYKSRGDRCEGEYSARVGAPSLEIVSLTIGTFAYKLEQTESIQIKNPTGTDINIRSSAIPIRTYYRMDAFLANGQTLKWDIKDVIYNLKIPSNSLGVYGWAGPDNDKTYVPVKPISSIYDKTNTNIFLIVRPSAKVLSAKYRYATVAQNLHQYKDVNRSFETGQPIVITLPSDLQGSYLIEITAQLESGSGWIKRQYKISIP